MRLPAKMIHWTFRYEWIAWVLLILICAVTYRFALPRVQYRFGFKDIFDAGHPAREEYEAFERDFELGPAVLVYFHGPTVFQPRFLEAMTSLSNRLERMPGVGSVLSALDLFEPQVSANHARLRRTLRAEAYSDSLSLERRLRQPPFSNHWHQLLYDDSLNTFVMIITPSLDTQNPRESVAFMQQLETEIQTHADQCASEFHLNGLYFITQEVIQVTSRTQRRLLLVIFVILLMVLWGLFGSLRASLLVFFVLGVSIYLSFGAMGIFGIPLNFMSTNFPLMILVIGTADIIHILGLHIILREHHSPRGAAIRAARRTWVPNLWTTLSTAGCIYFTSITDLSILKQFSLALCLGILIAYVVSMLYAPLLFQHAGLRGGHAVFIRLRRFLAGWSPGWLLLIRSRKLLWGFAACSLFCAGVAMTQHINSNWYRKFTDDQRLSKSLAFLQASGLPISTIDCTVDTDTRLHELKEDAALRRDVRRVMDVLATVPEVQAVFSVLSQLEYVNEQIDRTTFPAELDSSWVSARREGLLRSYLAAGAFDEYLSPRTGRLRIVGLGSIEDSARFLRVRDEITSAVARLPLESIRAADFVVTGQMIYWSHIMAAIPRTFLFSLWGSALVVFTCFLLVTHSWRWAGIAMLSNVVPAFVMIATARVLGWELTDNLCFLVSLSVGIAVDDTLHFSHHFRKARRHMAAAAAAQHVFTTVGPALIVTSLLLMIGFAVCVTAEIVTVQIIGVLIVVSIFVALLLDLSVLPAMLVRLTRRASS